MKKKKSRYHFDIELLDLWNEVGGQLVVECLTVKFKPTKEDLRKLRDKGLETDVMMVLVSEFIKQGKSKEEIVVFFEKVGAIGAAPSFSFEGGNIIYWCK